MKFVPDEFLLDAHHWLILHGRYTCIARKPNAPACVISDLCEYKKKNWINTSALLLTALSVPSSLRAMGSFGRSVFK